jgi:LacI family transcriptional regulator
MSTGLMRYRGFLDAMASLGLDVPDRAVVFASSFTEEAGAKAARELLSAWPACTAIVAANDLVALGVYRAAAELERAVPDDLSVVGFNDILFADKLAPPLTTIRIPVYELGTLAAQLLLERLESTRASARTMLLETQLVVRGSTAPPAG